MPLRLCLAPRPYVHYSWGMTKRASTAALVVIWILFFSWVGISAAANYAHGTDRAGGLLMAMAPVGFAVTMGVYEYAMAKGAKLGGGATTIIITVAAVSGFTSYFGLVGFALERRVDTLPAFALPMAFDGVVLILSLALRKLSSHEDSGQDVDLDKVLDKWLDERTVSSFPTVSRLDVVLDKTLDKTEGQDSAAGQDTALDIPLDKDTAAELDTWDSGLDELVLAAAGQDNDLDSEPAPQDIVLPRRGPRPKVNVLEANAEDVERRLAGLLAAGTLKGEAYTAVGVHYGMSAKAVQRFVAARAARPVSTPPAASPDAF